MAAEMEKLQGCCRGVEKLTPAKNENRPGLDSLNYRIGTHGSFLTTMKARLSDFQLDGSEGKDRSSPLQALTNRDVDDFSIALMDSWALIADVLTFYQERFANEGYLRTATERRSILELARLIGYAPRPGVAASVDLAFSLEKGYTMEIPAGTRVQSLPAPGELPQAFETSEKAKARAEWNLIKPRMTRPQSITWELACDTQEFFIYFQGTSTNLQPNQPLLFVLGDGKGLQVMRLIKSVEPQPKEQRTKVTVQKEVIKEKPPEIIPTLPEIIPIQPGTITAQPEVIPIQPGTITAQPEVVISKSSEVILKSAETIAIPFQKMDRIAESLGRSGIVSRKKLPGKVITINELNKVAAKRLPEVGYIETPLGVQISDPLGKVRGGAHKAVPGLQLGRLTIPKEFSPLRIYALRLTASLFGHNAPKYIPKIDGTFEIQAIDTTIEGKEGFYLDNSYDKILPGSWIAVRRDSDILIGRVEKATVSISREKYGITGKTTHIELENNRQLIWLSESYSLSWNDITDKKDKLIEFLTQKFSLDWVKTTTIERTLDGNTIKASTQNNSFSITRNDDEVSLEINGVRTDKIRAKMEKDTLNIKPGFKVLRETIVHAQSEDLTFKLAEEPVESDIRGRILELDGYYDGLDAGRCLVVSGQARADIGTMISDAEKITISEVLHGLLTTDRGYPAPQVELKRDSGSNYILSIKRWDAYSKDLFESAPEFAPCRYGSRALRTCLSIKKFQGDEVNTVTSDIDIDLSEGLDKFKFSLGSTPPELVFLEMRDRRRNVSFISNIVLKKDDGYSLDIEPPFIVTTDREANNQKILYNLSVINWFEYVDQPYEITVYYGGKGIKIQNIGSNKNLMKISFEKTLDAYAQEPHYIYLGIKPSGSTLQECYSNLASTVPSFFLAGDSPHTTLILEKGLKNTYQRDTVSIYANLVRATHGETRTEILGSGDASHALQQFSLRHSPLTYLPASTPSGASSTLEVRVNDILWHETDSLVGLGPIDRNYVSRMDDKGKTSITFGNGRQGARLPTGIENIKAKYRSGIGKPGNVRTGQISLLATRPLGLKGVTNPLPATGGADPESDDQARINAPLAVMALDRLVSVQDYEDFARCFAGIGKASAARLSDGRREVVHVSIAGVDDIPIDEDSDLFRNLLLALHKAGDPYQPLVLDLCERLLLMIKAGIRLHPDYLWSSVEPNIRAALQKAFSFERRQPGQDVVKSEVVSVIQSVPGVEFVDLDLLDSISEMEASDLVKTAKKIQKLMDDSKDSVSYESEEIPAEKRGERIVAELARVQNIHEVQENETLDSISLLYGMEVSELELLNQFLKELEPGTVLRVWAQLWPAQIAYLSSEIPEAVVLKELM